MLIFGSALFGRTYRVAGAFHVSTRFLHVMFFPFVPRSSWVVPVNGRRDALGDDVAYALPELQWRSVFLAWIRATLSVVGALATLVLCTQVLLDRSVQALAPAAAALLAAGIALWCSYRFDRPDAATLARLSGHVPAELAAQAKANSSV